MLLVGFEPELLFKITLILDLIVADGKDLKAIIKMDNQNYKL